MPVYRLFPSDIGAPLTQTLLVVMPVYNEEANIENVLAEWEQAISRVVPSFAFVIVNDGSTDNTQALLERREAEYPSRHVIVRKPNSGHGSSCRTGYDIACASQCEWVLQIDSDGQCDPAYFRDFWRATPESDCVFGVRSSRDDGTARRITSQICRWASSTLSGVDLRDPNVPYRMIRREALAAALRYIPPGFNIHNVALTFILRKTTGLRWRYLPIHFKDRQGGNNSINLLRVGQWGAEMLLELARLKPPTKS